MLALSCLFVRPHLPTGIPLDGFFKISYWRFLSKFVEKFQFFFKIVQKYWAHYVRTSAHCIFWTATSVCEQLSMSAIVIFYIVDSEVRSSTVEFIFAFPWAQLLHERPTILHYTYRTYIGLSCTQCRFSLKRVYSIMWK